jgi:prefoldin beta subunit
VQKEFKSLSSDSNIYKLVGPVLLKQDNDDAKRTVDGRLEYIEKEIKRVEGTIKELQEKSEKMRNELGALQQQIQMEQQQGGAGKGIPGK